MKNWQIGAIAGLIAGIIAGISFVILTKISVSIGLWFEEWRQPISNSILSNILISIIFGIILGIIFSKVYNIIPGKANRKGICFGLIIFLILTIRDSTYGLSYAYLHYIIGRIFTGFPKWTIYGLILGLLYEFLHKRLYIEKEKIEEYKISDGILLGAIAGFVGGTAASMTSILVTTIGPLKWPLAPAEPTFDFWLSQAGTHIFWNIIWGAVFGLIFTKAYSLVPSKGITKGLVYGLIIYLITTFHSASMIIGWGLSSSNWNILQSGLLSNSIGFFQAFFFGLVLGLLYRKPSK